MNNKTFKWTATIILSLVIFFAFCVFVDDAAMLDMDEWFMQKLVSFCVMFGAGFLMKYTLPELK